MEEHDFAEKRTLKGLPPLPFKNSGLSCCGKEPR